MLNEHIACTERHYFEFEFCCQLSLSLSLSHPISHSVYFAILYVFSFSIWVIELCCFGLEKAASRVMYFLVSSVGDQLLSYIRDAKTPKDAWKNLKKFFATRAMAKKLTSGKSSAMSDKKICLWLTLSPPST